MRIGTTWLAVGVVAAAAVAWTAGLARAGDPPADAPAMPSQKAIKHPLVDALLGSWNHSVTGDFGNMTGKATYALGVGDTFVIETYDAGPAGGKADFFGHGVFKVSEDGKTVTSWWFDNMAAEPMVSKGTITEKGYEIAGDSPMGKIRQTLEKTEKGFVFKMIGDKDHVMMTDTFERAK